MRRRKFVKSTAIGVAAASLLPTFAWSYGTIPQEELIGKGNPQLIERDGYRLRPEAARAFDEMRKAATQAGVPIQVVSSYRDYAHQNRIWKRKYKAYTAGKSSPEDAIKKIIEYSTIPGTSRHHWATDIDIIQANTSVHGDVLIPSKFHGKGPFCKLKEWLDIHAQDYGFYLVYTNAYGRKGFNYEPWHYSYKPLSKKYLESYKNLDLRDILKEQKLVGSSAFTPEFMALYRDENILDINPELTP